ncbi:MAG: arsenate reductase (glutaredoxin) [Proteobacteria bacterium]|nr:arsenate reductase (glutaredoxin) [Pseudomonadota bacterium]
MSEFTIYHNPRCSKSRTTLALLEENGITPDIVLYQEHALSIDDIEGLLAKLGISASQLVRRGEADFKEAGLLSDSADDEIIAAMADRPKLIERPIVVKGERAVLGRPPENVLALIS